MTEVGRIAGDVDTGVLLVADHASAQVPEGVDLGIPVQLLGLHIAVDLGIAPLTAGLAARLGAPALLGQVSRLVIDLNRAPDAAALIPEWSDGHHIPGNRPDAEERARRLDRYWRPYHAAVADAVAATSPRLIVSLHSFTPRLESAEMARPWEVGILYNRDERAPRLALPLLAAAGLATGDNEPYSGRVLNYTMDRHAEAHGIPYLGIEVRHDLLADDAGVARWVGLLGEVIAAVRDGLQGSDTTAPPLTA